jgi:hypothetical protein
MGVGGQEWSDIFLQIAFLQSYICTLTFARDSPPRTVSADAEFMHKSLQADGHRLHEAHAICSRRFSYSHS